MSFIPGNPIVEQYFQDIKDSKGFSSEKERELAQRIRQGDEEAFQELVQGNLLFVVTVAKLYQGRGLPFSDLISLGNLGLVEAARRFDGDKGFRFISYAVWWIRQAILQALKDQGRTVRLPSNRVDELWRSNKSLEALEQKLGRSPEPHEMAEALSLNQEDMDTLLSLAQIPVSLDTPLQKDEPGRCMRDLIPDDSQPDLDEIVSQEEVKVKIQQALALLTKREAQIVCMYYGLDREGPMILEEIGVHFGRTRERIRQIKEKALQKLRHPSINRILREYALDER